MVNTTEIESVSTWSVSPNLVLSGNEISINLDTQEAFEATVRMHSINGQLIKEVQRQQFNIGNNNMFLNIGDVENGTYLVAIQSENGIINNKIVIAK